METEPFAVQRKVSLPEVRTALFDTGIFGLGSRDFGKSKSLRIGVSTPAPMGSLILRSPEYLRCVVSRA